METEDLKEIKCPKCGSIFDVSAVLNRWKEETLEACKFLDRVRELKSNVKYDVSNALRTK